VTTHDEVAALYQQWADAFARRDLVALANLYATDATIESPIAGVVTGRDAVAQAHSAILTAFPDLQLTLEPPLIDVHGDHVAIVGDNSGTHSGTILGLPPTGRAFRFKIVLLWDIKDGLIVRDRRIYDFTGLLVQVGVLKAKPA
jgi:steroid delta-isomerase-like uncharacterized protein